MARCLFVLVNEVRKKVVHYDMSKVEEEETS